MRKTLILTSLVIGVASTAYAHGKATGIVRERMDSMVVLADTMKTLVSISKSSDDIDQTQISAAAQVLQTNAGTNLTALFPNGSTQHSEATQAVWTESAEFQRLADALSRSGSNLSAVTTKAELASSIREIGQTCVDCHQTYRQKTE